MAMYLGIDVGTYGSKGVIVDARGGIVAQTAAEHALSIPRPGWAEQDPEAVWWGDVCALSRELLGQAGGTGPEQA
jgi:xylulokinase